MPTKEALSRLRDVITENLRIQRSGPRSIPYIDVSHALDDARSRQNHVIFGRRGCGKTLLLDNATKTIYSDRKTIYLNCEDFKNHSFPNVLIEILDAVFAEMERHLTGWFGKKKKSKDLIKLVRQELTQLRAADDARYEKVRERHESENSTRFAGGLHTTQDASAKLDSGNGSATLRLGSGLSFEGERSRQLSEAVERSYERADIKIKQLDLPVAEAERISARFLRNFVFSQDAVHSN